MQLDDNVIIKDAELSHLYVDFENNIRDAHIEHMFEDLFHGRGRDATFRTNFRAYMEFMFKDIEVLETIFDNEAAAAQWIGVHFGALFVRIVTPSELRDPDLKHCAYRGTLRTTVIENAFQKCYAPTKIDASLLTVVNVFRAIALKYTIKRFRPNALPC